MVWYQKFEYAIGHWLQKAAEHMLGCVLCSPGCFSLFRGSAIMDDNVMRTYATKSTEARHYVQYDQGNWPHVQQPQPLMHLHVSATVYNYKYRQLYSSARLKSRRDQL